MKFVYPAVFRQTEEGTFQAYFPDLDHCEVQGETLNECIEQANEAAYNWIYVELTEFDFELPPISEPDDIELKEGESIRNISVNIRFTDGWDE